MPQHIVRRRVRFAALGLVVALVLIGCGSPGGRADGSGSSDSMRSEPVELVTAAADTVREAADRSAAQTTMQMSMVMTVDGEVATRMTSQSTADGSAAIAQVDVPPFGTIPMLMVDGAYYYQFPNLPPGKEWVRFGFDEIEDQLGIDPAVMQQTPGSAFDALESVSDDVVTVGEEEIAGVPTTHYRFSARVDELIDELIASGALTAEAVTGTELYEDGTEMDVWIDGDGLVRRLSYEVVLAEESGMGLPGSFGYEFEFSDYGLPVEVVAPAPEVTMSLSELMTVPS